MNWEVIGWSALTFIVLTAVLILAYFLYSRNMMKKRREALIQMDALIKPGKPCSFNAAFRLKSYLPVRKHVK